MLMSKLNNQNIFCYNIAGRRLDSRHCAVIKVACSASSHLFFQQNDEAQ